MEYSSGFVFFYFTIFQFFVSKTKKRWWRSKEEGLFVEMIKKQLPQQITLEQKCRRDASGGGGEEGRKMIFECTREEKDFMMRIVYRIPFI